jgi:hypothetical protein
MATAKNENDPAPTPSADDVDLDELNRRAAEAGAKATSADAKPTKSD